MNNPADTSKTSASRTADDQRPEENAALVCMGREKDGSWSLTVHGVGILASTLFEARGLKSLDDCLEALSNWRKGVVVA